MSKSMKSGALLTVAFTAEFAKKHRTDDSDGVEVESEQVHEVGS